MAFEWCPGTVARFRFGSLFFPLSTANPVGKYSTELFLGAVILCSASFSGLVIPRDALHFGAAGSQTTLRDSQPAGQWVQEDSVAGPLILERRAVVHQDRRVMEPAVETVPGRASPVAAPGKRTPVVQMGVLDLPLAQRIDQPAGPRTQEISVTGPLTLSQLYIALDKIPQTGKATDTGRSEIAPGPRAGTKPSATDEVVDSGAQPGRPEVEQLAKIQPPPAAEKILKTIPRPYIDQLIDEGQAAGEIDKEYRAELDQPQGRRFVTAEILHYQQDQNRSGTSMEDGVRLRAHRETLNFGELELEAALRSDRPSNQRGQDASIGGQLTLSQYGLALAGGWKADNTAGVLRSKADTGLSNTFRINLPTSLLGGLGTHLFTDHQDVRINVGKIGRLGTGQIQDFETENGWLASAGYSLKVNPLWRTAVHFVALRDDESIDDHESVAGLVEYLSLDKRQRYQAHTLVDSGGNYGVWLDADNRIGNWRHRYGLYYLQPELLWTNSQIANDEQGFYGRSELHRLRYFISTGLDYKDTNVNNDPDFASAQSINAFVSGTWRFRRRGSVGGTVSARDVQTDGVPDAGKSQDLRLTGFVSRHFSFGTTRLQGSVSRLKQNGDDGQGYAVDLDHSWNVSRSLQMSSSLSREVTKGVLDDEKRNSASLLFRHQLGSQLTWNGDFTFTRFQKSSSNTQDNINASLGFFWRFKPHWDAILRVIWNSTDNMIGIGPGTNLSTQEKTLLLTFRYTRPSGRPFEIIGSAAEGVGYGEVFGQVFFDENNDGERQADERVASNVVVVLDGRYERITDEEGRFSFTAVTANEHRVILLVEDLPLPWGLNDEAPRTFAVPVRGRVQVDFPLIRSDQQQALFRWPGTTLAKLDTRN